MELVDLARLLAGTITAIVVPIRHALLLRARTRRTAEVFGVVVGANRRAATWTGEHGAPSTQHAVVEYEVRGRTYTAVCGYGLSWTSPSPGERMIVLYDPRHPADAEVHVGWGWTAEHWLVLGLFVFGCVQLASFARRWLL